jgi:hypothetical protein
MKHKQPSNISVFDLYRRTGRTTRMLEEVRKAILAGNRVVLYIKQDIGEWILKLPNHRVMRDGRIEFDDCDGILYLRVNFDDMFNARTGQLMNLNCIVFIDHHLLEYNYGWVIETWLKQNNQI